MARDRPGRARDSVVEIKQGLEPGEQVALTYRELLRQGLKRGDPIKPATPSASLPETDNPNPCSREGSPKPRGAVARFPVAQSKRSGVQTCFCEHMRIFQKSRNQESPPLHYRCDSDDSGGETGLWRRDELTA